MQVRSVQRLPIPHAGHRVSPSVAAANGLSRGLRSRLRREIEASRPATAAAASAMRRIGSIAGSSLGADPVPRGGTALRARAYPARRDLGTLGRGTMVSMSTSNAADRPTEEQVLLRDAVRDLAVARIAPRAAEIDRTGGVPEDIRQLLAAQDVLALPFPVDHGGVGGDLLTVCLAIEQIARACATSSLILMVQELGALPLLIAGSPEQQARWFPDLAAGRTLAAFALTEPEAGSDAASLRTRAVADGDSYVITGTKRFITNGSVAGLITVFAVTDPDAPRHGRLSCFAVEVPAEGFRVERLEHR